MQGPWYNVITLLVSLVENTLPFCSCRLELLLSLTAERPNLLVLKIMPFSVSSLPLLIFFMYLSEFLLSFFFFSPFLSHLHYTMYTILGNQEGHDFEVIRRAMILKPSPSVSGPSFVRPSRLRWHLKEESYKRTL